MSERIDRDEAGDRCECSDPGCSVHERAPRCNGDGTATLYRIDMDDENGTLMCDDCTEEALNSGVFYSERAPMNRDRDTKIKSTPGPWFATGSNEDGPVVAHGGTVFGWPTQPSRSGGCAHAETMADARLAAASPDLLAACEAALDVIAHPIKAGREGKSRDIEARLRAAIARAKGSDDASC